MSQNEYPRMLYKAGGREEIHGGQFTSRIVADAEEHKVALADGWANTTPEAIEAAKPKAQKEDDAPTRAELEQKALELDIKFDGRTSDRKLGELIAEKLAGS